MARFQIWGYLHFQARQELKLKCIPPVAKFDIGESVGEVFAATWQIEVQGYWATICYACETGLVPTQILMIQTVLFRPCAPSWPLCSALAQLPAYDSTHKQKAASVGHDETNLISSSMESRKFQHPTS